VPPLQFATKETACTVDKQHLMNIDACLLQLAE
jgi:hypothetical protein